MDEWFKKKKHPVGQNVSPILILNIFLTLPKGFLQNLKSFKKKKQEKLSFPFFHLNLNCKFYQKNNSYLFSTDLSMKRLIPISFNILPKSYLIVVNCGLITWNHGGLNFIILVSEKSYSGTRTEREPGAQPNLSFSGKTFLI